MFKPGQKVRCISGTDYKGFDNLIKNKIYTVRDHSYPGYIELQEIRDSWFDHRFELVQEETNPDSKPLPEVIPQNEYGDRKNSGKLRWRNVPMFIFEPVVEVGALAEKRPDNPKGKYETFNFLKGMRANDTLDSLKRHLNAFESPYESDVDKESGLSHLAHIAWNALVLLHSLKQYPELDDRYQLPEKKDE